MSRSVILGLADGELNPQSPASRDFLMELCKLVSPYKEEWVEILNGSERWQMRAALHMLATMAIGGPKGGKPPIQAVCGQMLGYERDDKKERTDKDWRSYFFRSFLNAQGHLIEQELNSGANAELRRRLLKAFGESRITAVDKEHYGQLHAQKFDLDVREVMDALGERAPSGSSAIHSAVLPTIGDLSGMISDLIENFPETAPRFGIWMCIAKSVFHLADQNSTVSWDGSDSNDGKDAHDGAANFIKTSVAGEDVAVSHADVAEARSLIETILTDLDSATPFPDGKHSRTFVEFLLWSEKEGPVALRCTQQEYADKVGISDSTITNYRKAIAKALVAGGLFSEFGTRTIADALRQLQEQYLHQHLEVFGSPPLDQPHETDHHLESP